METEKRQPSEGSPPPSSTTELAHEVGNTDGTEGSIDPYPHGARLAAIILSLMLGMFLVSLDNVSFAPNSLGQSHPLIERVLDHHKHGDPDHHGRVPGFEQGVLVRFSLFDDVWWW